MAPLFRPSMAALLRISMAALLPAVVGAGCGRFAPTIPQLSSRPPSHSAERMCTFQEFLGHKGFRRCEPHTPLPTRLPPKYTFVPLAADQLPMAPRYRSRPPPAHSPLEQMCTFQKPCGASDPGAASPERRFPRGFHESAHSSHCPPARAGLPPGPTGAPYNRRDYNSSGSRSPAKRCTMPPLGTISVAAYFQFRPPPRQPRMRASDL